MASILIVILTLQPM